MNDDTNENDELDRSLQMTFNSNKIKSFKMEQANLPK